MSSRFVSAGSIDAATGEAASAPPPTSPTGGAVTTGTLKDKPEVSKTKAAVEWESVQKELEADRKRREDLRLRSAAAGGAGGEKSLYEVLQANKAAKQAAFEEANRIKNQFRALDDDEIDFLEGVRARERADEERRKRETEEGLSAFRARQNKITGGTGEVVEVEVEEGGDAMLTEEVGDWTAGRKRRHHRGDEKGSNREKKKLGVVKRRMSSSSGARAETKPDGTLRRSSTTESTTTEPKPDTKPPPPTDSRTAPQQQQQQDPKPKEATPPVKKGLGGLVNYGSSDDDDDDDDD
ncbi:N-terminal domain of NEFA-interacting nuclear protein NIP30-domain-containing protein [Diplogelasinospora grovesii]|uniref:N-terminal domain of NEFA-interacting nuclear protein NIP30-domain-containing protein n=1 Tax=Diplogelasinospora grovesii TaxID=303347 RepID=A0AAN6N5D8_9PEZI|nr:N-terminal domain of NEFA-interacting nuclear protein NIP30-domain-containing protein [Diplogelasinospora grovesii]